MATPQKIIHGTWSQSWAPLAVVTLFGLGLAHVWEFPFVAAQHGGLAFVLAWLACMLVLGLPLRMMELMLGRRSRRSPVEGMAFLTREADAQRYWRVAAWGSLVAAVVGLAGLALLAGWSFSFLAHHLASPDVYTANYAGPGWALGVGGVVLVAAGLAWAGMQRLAPLYFVLWAIVLLLLLVGAWLGMDSAGPVLLTFNGTHLGFVGWVLAARFALLSLGGGMGLLWLAGAYLPADREVANLAVSAVLLQIVLTLLAALTLAPVIEIAATLPGKSALLDQLPAALTSRGALALIVYSCQALAALAAVALLGEVVRRFLEERGLPRAVALVITYVVAGLLAEGIWLGHVVEHSSGLLSLTRAGVLLVLLVMSVYTGWAMKISHARKELNLPSEAIYNLWRVAVRILCPLAILVVLVGSVWS